MNIKEIEKSFDEKYKSVYEAYPDFQESHSILLTDIKFFYRQRIKEWALSIIPEHDVGCEIQHTGKCSCAVGKMEDNILKQFEV